MPHVPPSLAGPFSSTEFSLHPLASILAADPSTPSPREQRLILLDTMSGSIDSVPFLYVEIATSTARDRTVCQSVHSARVVKWQ